METRVQAAGFLGIRVLEREGSQDFAMKPTVPLKHMRDY